MAMKQAISGVTPAETAERTIMTVFPSIAAYPEGRLLGRGYSIRWPDLYIFRLGNFIALLSIPAALALYFYRLAPSFFGLSLHGSSYRLTNRRIIEVRSEFRSHPKFPFLRFVFGAEVKSVDLDRFDAILIDRLPGQEWYDAGDLVFRMGNVETFRLSGVSRPESFRQTCFKAHMAYVGVRKAMQHEATLHRETALT